MSMGIRHRHGSIEFTNDHGKVVTHRDNKTLRFNSRDYATTSGNHIGLQSKPNQTGSGTADITGAEFSPRYNDAAGGTLTCIKADPVLKDATEARTVGAVRALGINIDLPGSGSAYTITNDVSAIRVFGDFGAGHTFSGDKTILLVATPNTSQWDYLLVTESGNSTIADETSGTYTTAEGFLKIKVNGSDYQIPFYTAAD